MGVDLSGSPEKISGIAILDGSGELVCIAAVSADIKVIANVILGFCHDATKGIVAVDSPLDVPRGKQSGFRDVDKEMIRRGLRVLPLGSVGMRMLIGRAEELTGLLRRRGFEVIETHPRSSLSLAGCTYEDWDRCVGRYIGVKPFLRSLGNRDLVDAIVAATTALLHGRNPPGDLEIRSSDGAIHLLPPQ